MYMNSKMTPYWKDFKSSPNEQLLPRELRNLLDSKFVEMYGCRLLDSMIPEHLKPQNDDAKDFPETLRAKFQDRTGLEHFVSKTHIDGFVQEEHFNYAVTFLSGVFQLFKKQFSDNIPLRGIISISEGTLPDYIYSCCVAYHLKRDDESWLTPDIEDGGLENYDDALFVMDSDEDPIQ